MKDERFARHVYQLTAYADLAAQAASQERDIGVSSQATSSGSGTGGIDLNNTMQYKGYVGSVEFSEADGLFFGKVLGIRALSSYEGTNAAELVADFHGAVDDYLSLCEAESSGPERAY